MTIDVIGGCSNTRPPNTVETPLRVLVDWVSIGFNLEAGFDDVFDLLGLSKLEFEFHDWGMNTYHKHARFSNIVVQQKDEFRYQLNLSGQGCREFEDYSTLDWYQLFAILKDLCDGKATRIDLAIDDFKGYYNVGMVRRAVKNKLFRTRMRMADDRVRYNLADVSTIMDSFYIGSMDSRLSINFYDKKLERESKDLEVTEKFWTRTELRCKKDYADQVIDMILLHENIGTLAMGILKKHITFIRKSNATNKSRVPAIKWWDDFLKNVESVQLSVKAPDKTLEKTKNWLGKSVAPSLATVKESDPLQFDEFMRELLEDGESRLNIKHQRMIDQYQDQKYKAARSKIIELNGEIESDNLNTRILKQLNKKSPFSG